MTRAIAAVLTVLWLAGGMVSAADQTWTGTISDNMCKKAHKSMVLHNKQETDPECVSSCVKMKAKYVFVVKDQVFKIQNQDFAGLADQAGKSVTISGELTGDTIKVAKVTAEKKAEKS